MIQGNKKIIVNSVSKSFSIGHKGNQGILSKIIDLVSGKETKKILKVLSGVNFEIEKGEVVGLIGRNGSGKSTLMRVVAGIYNPNEGFVSVDGDTMYINGFNYGTKPKLTMSENIFLTGSIAGFSKREISSKFDDIVSFSGLGDFVNTKLYQFSSGMITRLNFSIFIHFLPQSVPDVLLIDEVLGAGGDIDFSKKAESKINDFIASGSTVLIASHNLSEIKRLCSKVLWIDKGFIKEFGQPVIVIGNYLNSHKTGDSEVK